MGVFIGINKIEVMGMTYEERFRQLKKLIGSRFDVANVKLSPLVIICLDHDGKVPDNLRDHYRDAVPPGFFDALEGAFDELFGTSEDLGN